MIVFVGYSGSDAFDVEPFLRRLSAGSLAGKTVLWVRYAREQELSVPSRSTDARVARHLDLLHRAGAVCVEVSGDPVELLERFARAWDLLAPTPSGSCPPAWTPVTVEPAAGWRASLELWAMMGVHREVRRLLTTQPPRATSEFAISAQTSWAEGRYRQAATQWRRIFPSTDPVSRASRAERAGSVLWVQGRLLHAYWVLNRALNRALREGVDGEPLWLLAEALGHVLVHMRRRPLLRHFVTDQRKQRVLAHLPTAPSDGYASLGVHLDARFGGVIAALNGTASDQAAPITSFDEAEALKAMLSYRHADLRRRTETGEPPAPEEYRRQRDHCLALGAYGDAPRVYSIPGATSAFTLTELRHDLKGVQLATWPRLLLLTRFRRERRRRPEETPAPETPKSHPTES